MEFINYTKQLNELATKLQDKAQEIISEEDIIKAVAYLNNIKIEDTGDCLIFLSSLNLCNTYVKQQPSKISYSFKKCIEYILDTLNEKQIDDITISKSKDKGTLFIFQIGYIQFSFHDEKKVDINEKYIENLTWDGIRKQKCAKSIFNSTINNKIRVANKTHTGENLKEKISKIVENYRLEKIDSKELTIIKI